MSSSKLLHVVFLFLFLFTLVCSGTRLSKQFPDILANEPMRPDVVVAKDGSGKYKTIKEAIVAMEGHRTNEKTYVIYVKLGVYNENIVITKGLKNIKMIGDGINKTVITSDRSAPQGLNLFGTATFLVEGAGFIAQDISFRNTAGPKAGQAVAVASNSDCSVFYKCSFEGYQDTLYAYANRQFYRECDIYGTIDFIFGNAAAVFQNCTIYSRMQEEPGHVNMITAQSREDPNENTGFSIHNSRVIAPYNTVLGRPWKEYSRTAFLQTYLDKQVQEAGWIKFRNDSDVNKVYYREYNNTGPGSSTEKRVNWTGYRALKKAEEAQEFTVAKLIDGLSWLPGTNVPYILGL